MANIALTSKGKGKSLQAAQNIKFLYPVKVGEGIMPLSAWEWIDWTIILGANIENLMNVQQLEQMTTTIPRVNTGNSPKIRTILISIRVNTEKVMFFSSANKNLYLDFCKIFSQWYFYYQV